MELELNQEKLEMTDELDRIQTIEKDLDEEKALTVSKENGVDRTIQDVTKRLEKNIDDEVAKISTTSPIWEKINQSKFKDVVKFVIETSLKIFLKKKFNINFSTFNDMKNAINSAMDGNAKDAIKKASDAALDQYNQFDSVTKSAIKGVKNNVIDTTISNEKYEIINKQTKLINRIGNNCQKFNEALAINDVTNIKKSANAIQKDMKQILPIRETINQAQIVLDKYELWKNNGNQALSFEENELIEKLHKSA